MCIVKCIKSLGVDADGVCAMRTGRKRRRAAAAAAAATASADPDLGSDPAHRLPGRGRREGVAERC